MSPLECGNQSRPLGLGSSVPAIMGRSHVTLCRIADSVLTQRPHPDLDWLTDGRRPHVAKVGS
jgi:hypothetical protein